TPAANGFGDERIEDEFLRVESVSDSGSQPRILPWYHLLSRGLPTKVIENRRPRAQADIRRLTPAGFLHHETVGSRDRSDLPRPEPRDEDSERYAEARQNDDADHHRAAHPGPATPPHCCDDQTQRDDRAEERPASPA